MAETIAHATSLSRCRCLSTGPGRGRTRTISPSISITWATALTDPSPTMTQGVDGVPPVIGDDGRGPWLASSSVEQPSGRGVEGGVVDVFFQFEDLEVDQVMGAFIAAGLGADRGAGVELLGDLVVEGQERDRIGAFESDDVEQLDDVVSDAQVVLLGAADLVVAELEGDAQPMPALEGEADHERSHDVVVGQSPRHRPIESGASAGHAPCRSSCPRSPDGSTRIRTAGLCPAPQSSACGADDEALTQPTAPSTCHLGRDGPHSPERIAVGDLRWVCRDHVAPATTSRGLRRRHARRGWRCVVPNRRAGRHERARGSTRSR